MKRNLKLTTFVQKQTENFWPQFNPARREGETFEDYKKRQAKQRRYIQGLQKRTFRVYKA